MGWYKRESNRISRAENSIWNKKVWLDGLNRIRENENRIIETSMKYTGGKKGLKTMNRTSIACETVYGLTFE